MSAPVDWEPLRALVPAQAPEAVQAVALVDDQVRVGRVAAGDGAGARGQADGGRGRPTETIAVLRGAPAGTAQDRV